MVVQCILGLTVLDVQCLFSGHCICSHKTVVLKYSLNCEVTTSFSPGLEVCNEFFEYMYTLTAYGQFECVPCTCD